MKKTVILCITILLIAISIVLTILIYSNKINKNPENTGDSKTENSTNATPTPVNSIDDQLNKYQISLFNSNFDVYAGKNVDANQIKALISSIKTSNASSSIRKVSLSVNNEEQTIPTLDIIKNSSTYTVKFEYDSQGLISKAIINELS